MRKNTLWCIPCAFFLVAVALNLLGCIQGTKLAAMVKPALLPLLSATTLAYLLGHGHQKDTAGIALLLAAQLFGCTGDILLMPDGFWLFVGAFAGVIRMPRGRRATWWILLGGALLFTFSDSCIAMGTFGVMTFPLRHFVVMVTYLAAQSLLAVGGVRLILGR